jgi:serine/threonine protein kinase
VRFGHYYLCGLIARGGMAEVYRARFNDGRPDNRMLAIKVMRPELVREARFVDMFHREGQLALLLRDDAIVETVELGDIDGRHYIAMEYIGGRDLTQILRRCQKTNLRIPVPHAVHMGVGIAKGLDFAHNLAGADGRPLSLVNRDVSPSNVRIAFTGEVKLLDFGIAQALMKFTSEIGVLKGKFSYMSPEQIRGMPVDQRTDIFSAGIIIHELLTTEKLFRGDTEFALMERVRKAEISPPSKYNRRVSPELDRIVMTALERDVSNRYQDAAEMHQDLKKVLEGYRFDIRELRDFMRKEFKKEYTKDLAETEEAMSSLPENERVQEVLVAATPAPAPAPRAFEPPPDQVAVKFTPPPQQVATPVPDTVPEETPPPPDGEPEAEAKGGLWKRMFGKKK